MTERFRINIVRKNFISFKPRHVPDGDKDRFNPRIIWPFVHDNVLVDREIDDLRGNGFEFHFPGRIKIVLRELEIPGFVVGRDSDIMGADAAHGGHQIPSAKITVEIDFTVELPDEMMAGLSWNREYVMNFSLEEHYQSIVKKQAFAAREMIEDRNYELSREDEPIHRGVEKTKKLLEMAIPSLLTEMKEMGGSFDIPEKIDASTLEQILPLVLDGLASPLSTLKASEDKTGRANRSAIASTIQNHTKVAKIDSEIAEGAKKLGSHIFALYRNYMNKVIRYYKYERMQHWLEEIRPSEEGYFFINNRAEWIGHGEIILLGYHSFHLALLTRRFSYLAETDWRRSLKVVSRPDELDKYAEGFSVNGVFSQAYKSLIDLHFEQALVLGVIGLEATLRFILEEQEEYPDVLKTPLKPKTDNLYEIIEAAKKYFTSSMIRIPDTELTKAWGIAQTARKSRNSIVHKKKHIPKTKDKRELVLKYLDTLRRLSYQIDKWRERTFQKD